MSTVHKYNTRSRSAASLASASSSCTNKTTTSTSVDASTPLSSSSELMSFTLFPYLPPELRIQIWLLATGTRIVSIRHNSITHSTPPSRSQITENYPALLGVNHESRSLTLPLYTPLFPLPKNSRRSTNTKALIPQTCASGMMNRALCKAQATIPSGFAAPMSKPEHKPAQPRLLAPSFFSPKIDIIYLSRAPPESFGTRGQYQSFLLSPKHALFKRVTRLALEIDSMTVSHKSDLKRRWTDFGGTWKNLEALNEIWLVCLSDREILQISFDEGGKLKEKGEWSFRLMTKEEESYSTGKRLMGPAWAGVAWDIKLGHTQPQKKEKTTLWTVAKGEWRINFPQWETDKHLILQGKDGIDMEWWNTRRVYTWNRGLHYFKLSVQPSQLLESGDGETYLGPSR